MSCACRRCCACGPWPRQVSGEAGAASTGASSRGFRTAACSRRYLSHHPPTTCLECCASSASPWVSPRWRSGWVCSSIAAAWPLRVAPGDRILVDRLAAEPGSSVKLGRVLLVNDGGEVKVGNPAVDGIDVDAKVLAHRKGPRIESIRYKSKKRVRVHRGGRAYLTA